jgi:predicted deacylase
MQEWKFELVPAPAPGARRQGRVAWGDPVVTGWDWPFVAVRGAQPGPAVLVTAGIHGSEYPSIDAAVRLGASLDPASVRGQILCLPLLNPGAFWERAAYVSPVDNLNLNRVFPGKPKGSFSERLAWLLVEKAMRHADAYLDMHGGDLPEALVPFTIYQETGDAAVDGRSRMMASAFGSPNVLVQRPTGGPIAGLAYAAAAGLGIPAIIAEDGGAGVYADDVAQRMLDGAENVLRSLGALAGAVRNTPPPRQFESFVWQRSPHAGFFKPRVQVGDTVAAGTVLGTIGDFFGRTVAEIVAEADGQILFFVISPAIAQNGLICGIGASAPAA